MDIERERGRERERSHLVFVHQEAGHNLRLPGASLEDSAHTESLYQPGLTSPVLGASRLYLARRGQTVGALVYILPPGERGRTPGGQTRRVSPSGTSSIPSILSDSIDDIHSKTATDIILYCVINIYHVLSIT